MLIWTMMCCVTTVSLDEVDVLSDIFNFTKEKISRNKPFTIVKRQENMDRTSQKDKKKIKTERMFPVFVALL